jgi:hypothetical protein
MSAPTKAPSRTTYSPSTKTCRARRSGPRTSPASGSRTSARSSPGQTTTSARSPGSSRPTSVRPRQRAPPSVARRSASTGPNAVGSRLRWRARNTAIRSSGSRPPISLDATPSTPRPTGAPAATRSAVRAMPDPRRQLLDGQCATPVPAAPRRATSASSKWMPCATHTSSAIQPSSSSRATGRRPNRATASRSSATVSARWVCSRSPRRRASAADSAISLVVTLNGLHGATVTAMRSPSCSRACTASVEARIASRSSTTESGGSPPRLCPRSIDPRAMCARTPIVRAARAIASKTLSSPPGTT